MNRPSLDHTRKWLWSPAGAEKIWRPGPVSLAAFTNIGSPGPVVWYTRREPSVDQSNSATPSRYGRGDPPRIGVAQIAMPAVLGSSGLRTQNVTSDPSGENPSVRTDGLPNSRASFRVTL